MPISFNGIPANLRVPGVFIEINNDLANSAVANKKIVVTGQQLPAGSAQAGALVRVSSKAQADQLYGRGSMLASMLSIMLDNNTYTEIWAVGLDDNPAGVAASGYIRFVGAASHNGTIRVYIGGKTVAVGVAAGTTAATLATNIVAAINANSELLVTAAVDGVNNYQVNLTAKNLGLAGNEIVTEVLYEAASTPSAPAITINALAGGTTNPDIAPFLTALGDEWWHWIAFPYNDATSLTALEAELLDRWGPMRGKPGRAFISFRGTHAAASTFGNSRNSHLVCCVPAGQSLQPSYLWAAASCAVAAASLSENPSRQLRGLALRGILPPNTEDRWTDAERNVHLWDGLSTYTVDSAGIVRLERMITMYQVNESGLADNSYLDVTLLETQDAVRYEQRKHLASVFARYSLAADASGIAPGVQVVDPKRIKAELGALYQDKFIPAGWCEDYSAYMDSLLVEVDVNDPTRVNFRDVPNYTAPLYVIAGKQQFIV